VNSRQLSRNNKSIQTSIYKKIKKIKIEIKAYREGGLNKNGSHDTRGRRHKGSSGIA
jgi:hypothetical protein